jgi:membrane dipeptidase
MPALIDAHCDLAWNMLTFGRDYTLSAAETRAREKGSIAATTNGDTLIGVPDYRRGQVAIVFSTLFATPRRAGEGAWDKQCYTDVDGAHRLYSQQLDLYHQLADEHADEFCLIVDRAGLRTHMSRWAAAAEASRQVGLVILMEGADGIRNPEELAEWHARGLRLIGLSWAGTRYAGGTREPGPLSEEGRELLKAMADFNFVLDLSHMDERAAREAIDLYGGPIVATHVNCLSLLPDFPTNRHFPDDLMRAIIRRGGVVGNVPVNSFLKSGWALKHGSRKEEVPLDAFAAHLDHICEIAGDSLHAGIGSDFDGGFGVQSVPNGVDTIADLQKLVPLLEARGYSESDAVNIFGLNWLRLLEGALPS